MVRIPPFRRLVVSVALALALGLPPSAWSAPPEVDWPTSIRVVRPFARLWGLFASLWLKEGLGIDPSGQCATTATTEGGLGIDPSGQCATTATTEGGLGIDPDGQCLGGR
jgi:hypothetical protein